MKIKPVQNWRHGWKWLSNWAFTIVIFLATTPFPPELVMLLPEKNRTDLIVIAAMAGIILRFIDQSKNRTWS